MTDKSDTARADTQQDMSAPLCLALSFLLAGLAYASPLLLIPKTHPFSYAMSMEIINLYCIVAWMGLSHFIFAYMGQAKAFKQSGVAGNKILAFVAILIIFTVALGSISGLMGSRPFAAIVWIYFIPHFIKAERLFAAAGQNQGASPQRRFVFVFPTLAFTYFTFVLFCPLAMIEPRWKLIGLALLIVALSWRFGVVQQLKEKRK